jgi:glycosyl transferase family 2
MTPTLSVPMLQELYQEALVTPSDINEHLPTLYGLARECDHVTEMGTRSGGSTRAFLYAQPEELVCYDLVRQLEVDRLEAAARQAGRPRFSFHQADVLQAEIQETDLLFIDTFHVYEQIKQELARHAHKVRKYLVFHDTTTFGETGEVGGSRGIWPAIEEFLRENPEWRVVIRLSHNNGLTIVRNVAASRNGRMAQPTTLNAHNTPVAAAGQAPSPFTRSPHVVIVVPVHNALDYVQRSLTTLVRTCPRVPLIVVDDYSSEETHRWLCRFLFEECPGTEGRPHVLLRNDRQQLFTRTVNRGLRRAYNLRRAPDPVPIDFIAVVNTDCDLQENWLKALLLGMDDPQVGLVGFPDHADGEEPAYRETQEPAFIAGHCILLRMPMLEEIGVFCESDTDGRDSPNLAALKGQAHVGSDRGLSWRAIRAGWKTISCHCPLCCHPGGGSWHNDLAWLASFDLRPLWPPCDTLENPGWVEQAGSAG